MLVYGDHSFAADLHTLCARLHAAAQCAVADPQNRDRLRALLVACGQVEQGAHDALARDCDGAAADYWIATVHAATAHAAAAFYSRAWQQPARLPAPRTDTGEALANLIACLQALTDAPNVSMSVKLPEGFNLHALYPEQYAVAAARWLADHGAKQAPVIVVGIRSIGTTLAAVVATVLRAAGWEVTSFTVRPGGHPFARQVDLREQQLAETAYALVVDEGPGISGSSLAATAAALAEAGVAPNRIAFLPGHANDPGGAGSEEVQRWWRTTPRYVATNDDITFDGLPLLEALAASLPEPVTEIENFSGGTWRRALYYDAGEWPAICNGFERVKYRFTLRSGRRVLYKFLGLAAASPGLETTGAACAALLAVRAESGLSAPSVAHMLGFVATPWLEGAPLAQHGAPPQMPEVLGAYIARAAGPALTQEECGAATAKLVEMIYVNTAEALGSAAAEKTREFSPSPSCPRAAYGDGHLQPYEWIGSGAPVPHKVDGVGHDCDHTLVGRQPVAWDVAGAVTEWQLDVSAARRLLQTYHAAGGPRLDAATCDFYLLAYTAFRTGQCALAAENHDPYERERLTAALARYRQQLESLLAAAAERWIAAGKII